MGETIYQVNNKNIITSDVMNNRIILLLITLTTLASCSTFSSTEFNAPDPNASGEINMGNPDAKLFFKFNGKDVNGREATNKQTVTENPHFNWIFDFEGETYTFMMQVKNYDSLGAVGTGYGDRHMVIEIKKQGATPLDTVWYANTQNKLDNLVGALSADNGVYMECYFSGVLTKYVGDPKNGVKEGVASIAEGHAIQKYRRP